jgi:hypothetical protein
MHTVQAMQQVRNCAFVGATTMLIWFLQRRHCALTWLPPSNTFNAMIGAAQIDSIVAQVARKNLGQKLVQRTFSDPTIASDGNEALRITIVIAPKAVAKFKGDSVLDTLVQIHDGLLAAGEERFPIVEYATEEELADADSES